MVTDAIFKALQVYGIAIVISLVVAVLIKVLVAVTGRIEKAKPIDVPTGTVCPIGLGVPDEDVAALSAAIFVAIGRTTFCTLHQPAMAGQQAHAPPSIPIRRGPRAEAPDRR
jgi:hypothetical protein